MVLFQSSTEVAVFRGCFALTWRSEILYWLSVHRIESVLKNTEDTLYFLTVSLQQLRLRKP